MEGWTLFMMLEERKSERVHLLFACFENDIADHEMCIYGSEEETHCQAPTL